MVSQRHPRDDAPNQPTGNDDSDESWESDGFDRPPQDDDELIELAKNAANGRRFSIRFTKTYKNSTLNDEYDTRRDAELALLCNLAWWTSERERTWELFKRSALYQHKYESMPEYKQELLDAAIDLVDSPWSEKKIPDGSGIR